MFRALDFDEEGGRESQLDYDNFMRVDGIINSWNQYGWNQPSGEETDLDITQGLTASALRGNCGLQPDGGHAGPGLDLDSTLRHS